MQWGLDFGGASQIEPEERTRAVGHQPGGREEDDEGNARHTVEEQAHMSEIGQRLKWLEERRDLAPGGKIQRSSNAVAVCFDEWMRTLVLIVFALALSAVAIEAASTPPLVIYGDSSLGGFRPGTDGGRLSAAIARFGEPASVRRSVGNYGSVTACCCHSSARR